MSAVAIDTRRPGVPFARLLLVELRKMFDTRSGFWLLMSVAIISSIATIAVIAFVPDRSITFDTFGAAVGFPLNVLLPVMAILLVTSEWTQRTGLVTFALAPHRGTVIAAKAIVASLVGAASTLVAYGIGAVGNLIGAAVNGLEPVWNSDVTEFCLIVFGQVLSVLIGFMFGALIRNSAGAIVAYVAYTFLLPTIFGALAALTDWFKDVSPWVDFGLAQSALYDTPVSSEEWAHLGVTGLIWFVIPMAVALWAILRSEVK